MRATGLSVFDRTLQTTNIWLDEITAKLGPDPSSHHFDAGQVAKVRDALPRPCDVRTLWPADGEATERAAPPRVAACGG